ncbi:class I SAM-dependent methyltransferase [Micromonospora chalcea]|uniref:class I SAM-dependent methyltransferase n=1 Tax=Micromonospora chalcea TaxID=1874 RepID=UPI00157CC818|nr:class I SAM-dependent methyltransferase [Micromonospora chalcea]
MFENLKIAGRAIRTVFTADPITRVRRFYEIQSPDVEFAARRTHYMNVGYWSDGLTDIDTAADALADKLADAAGLKPDDTVLDVGFGYGDQDFKWLRERQVAKVYGLNITPHHVEAAQRRAQEEGLADRTDFRLGSATELPFEDNTFDRVVALESAFHFYPRSAFFAEALRVLRPGGVLATADIIPVSGDVVRAAIQSGPLSFVKFSIPKENWHDRDTYRQQLVEAGFANPEVRSIKEQTWEGWRAYMAERTNDPAFRAVVKPAVRKSMAAHWKNQDLMKRELAQLDYVIAVGHKR